MRNMGNGVVLWITVMLSLAFVPIAGCSAAPPGAQRMAADFSDVDSVAEAQRRVARGELVATYFFPTEFGGPDNPENIAYITPQAAEARARVITELGDLVADGVYTTMDVEPDYAGKSVVPTRIRMIARNSATGAQRSWAVEIW